MEKLFKTLSTSTYFGIIHKMEATYLTQKYQDLNIQYGHHQYLIALFIKDGQSQDELTKFLNTDKVVTTRAIERLNINGYVKIETDAHDKRYKRVYLTPYAYSKKDNILTIYQEWEKELFKSLDSNEIKALDTILKKIFNDQKASV